MLGSKQRPLHPVAEKREKIQRAAWGKKRSLSRSKIARYDLIEFETRNRGEKGKVGVDASY